jgi:hypothetical protein
MARRLRLWTAKLKEIVVEHVHIFPGGQAIVGTVAHGGVPGGLIENREQPHATNDRQAVVAGGSTAMRSQNSHRKAMSVSSG